MPSRSKPAGNALNARELCLLSMTGALIFVSKLVLSGIPNVNLNTLLIILSVVFFGGKAFYAVALYVLLEGLVFGFSLWWFSYLYTWPAVTFVIWLFRKNGSPLLWAAVAGLCGLCFGPLMYLLYFFVNGWQTAFSMWVAGIPYDLVHCAGNFVLTLILYRPLYRVFLRFLPETGSDAKTQREALIMKEFIAYCGLDCETCDARLATVNNDEKLRENVAQLWSELNGVPITPEMIHCAGCRIDGVKTPYCDSLCPIRQCALGRKVQTCGDCSEMYTCEKLAAITKNNEEALRNLRT